MSVTAGRLKSVTRQLTAGWPKPGRENVRRELPDCAKRSRHPCLRAVSQRRHAEHLRLHRVAVGKESLIVESNGYPIVALLPYAEYEEFKRERARLEADKFTAEQQVVARKLGIDKLGEGEVMTDALQAVEATRRGKRIRSSV